MQQELKNRAYTLRERLGAWIAWDHVSDPGPLVVEALSLIEELLECMEPARAPLDCVTCAPPTAPR